MFINLIKKHIRYVETHAVQCQQANNSEGKSKRTENIQCGPQCWSQSAIDETADSGVVAPLADCGVPT